ncbi:MAG: NHL repeat-containing protein [Actinomycetes bacterium]|jgi:hypothetical protein|nr:NHL repeat-containing protein [Actinomycetes bacterium]
MPDDRASQTTPQVVYVPVPVAADGSGFVPGQALDQEQLAERYAAQQQNAQRRRRRLLAVLLVLLIVLLLAACGLIYYLMTPHTPTPANTAGINWQRSVYGYGDSASQLHNPNDVSVAPGGGSFWVADGSHFRVIEYNINGTFKRVVTHFTLATSTVPTALAQADTKPADGRYEFNYPSRILQASDGTIYVAEQTYNQVLVFDRDFRLQQVLKVTNPQSLAVNDELLAIGGRGGFGVFSRTDYTLVGKIGQVGSGDDQFDLVAGLVLDADNNVFVLDTYNNRVSKYDSVGDKVWVVQLGVAGNGGITGGRDADTAELLEKYPGNLQMPMGLCMDGAGRLVIIDMFDFSVNAYSATDGSFINKWGSYGRDDGFFEYPSALAYDLQQDVFLEAEPALGRVQLFRVDGSASSALPGLRNTLNPLLTACCIPLLLILLILAAYLLWRRYRRRSEDAQRNRQALATEGTDEGTPDAP